MKFVKQLSIIMAVSFVAEVMEYLIPLPVAASVYGLILMLLGLITKIIPLSKVEDAADFLVEIMPILFVPPTVSIMTSVEAMKQMLVPLCVISVVSTVLIMVVTGRVSQGIIRHKSKEGSSR
ncbi:MAG: CidA/LrgA family protein [Lachnospiraceae bacterium]|nr:CidA/LrgA family protein [Lachnospiraceae bacterium]